MIPFGIKNLLTIANSNVSVVCNGSCCVAGTSAYYDFVKHVLSYAGCRGAVGIAACSVECCYVFLSCGSVTRMRPIA